MLRTIADAKSAHAILETLPCSGSELLQFATAIAASIAGAMNTIYYLGPKMNMK